MRKIHDSYTLKVADIFESMQGEGQYAGYMTTFIRLSGCNLQCSYCDTDHSKSKEILFNDLLKIVESNNNKFVCITGGEPLLQKHVELLARILVEHDYYVSIETNGSVLVPIGMPKEVSICMDMKMPSSGMADRNIYSALNALNLNCELKFVVSDTEDVAFAFEIMETYLPIANIVFSPKIDERTGFNKYGWLVPYVQLKLKQSRKFNTEHVRIGVQMHKVLNCK